MVERDRKVDPKALGPGEFGDTKSTVDAGSRREKKAVKKPKKSSPQKK